MENKQNGKSDPGPSFEVYTNGCKKLAIIRRIQVIEMLEKNGIIQSKQNLAVGPLFRKIADQFRQWSRVAEPGQTFSAPEAAGMFITRLTDVVPPYVVLSDEAEKRAEAVESGETANFPRIATE